MGTETLVDAYGCDPALLRSSERLAALAEQLVEDLGLHPIREPLWHAFGGGGGITGLLLLAESHVAIHTFPERRFAAVSLYCCRPRPDWSWDARLRTGLGATEVRVRTVVRGDRLEGAAQGSGDSAQPVTCA